MASALADVQTGRAGIWQGRAQRISVLIGQAETAVRRLGSLHDVSVNGTDLGPLVALATTLAQHLSAGNSVKMAADGTPKVGAFAAKPVKQAHELFSRVRVNGLPPTTPAQLDAFVTWVDATRTMTALDRAWPDGLHIPAEDTLHERLQWHVTEFAQLRRVVEYGAAVAAAERCLDHLRLPGIVDWTSPTAVRGYILLIDAAYAAEELAATRVPFQRLEPAIADRARQPDASPTVRRLHAAIQQRDEREYTAAYGRLHRLAEVRRIIHRRDALGARIASAAPAVRRAIEDSVADEVWNRRAATFRQAWDWAATATWLRERETLDVNALQAEVTVIERRIRHEVEELASTRAWGHAVSEDRLTGTARANLEQYAYLVRRHGKGTGKYAVQQRAEIRQAMDRCRPAVPVWIMPIYRIAEHLRITPNMFDVVIVDEASQAGLEATFLQYLAPKIVVIGDDKQVSPSAVGIDRQQLRDLARQYLLDDPYRASWQDPQRSLFDEAKMRFHGLLTLVEHRRCVPEIIGFSNRIAYEPDGVRLIPVRQYGSDRLEPIKPVLVADGYVRGTSTHKINPGEVDAIVDQIEKCIADPRYDGLTFGVISLLGKAQARAIEKKLLDRIPAAEWSGRDLRCGDSADFQGSERDVIFLSMVAAPEPDQPLRAVTGDAYVQRYNVAASRAKDQMWLFHSVPLADVGNPEDLRFQLLDYCYGVVRRADAADAVYETPTGSVPHDRLVSPFDSLFEQRVFNRLFDRGHTVVPQYPVESYKIDLVVVGPKTRLAIECDGDAWHGPDAYERDLARQRELERCGWRFFRIRESAFCVDEPGVLRDLWETLASLDIHPSGVSLDEAVPAPPTAVPLDEPEPAGISVPQAVQPSIEEPAPASVPGEEPSDDAGPVSSSAQPSPLAARDWPVVGPTAPNGTALAAYEEFRGTVTPALEASRQQLLDGI
ncbi:MAG TPA: AAA domain-containing protein, partial [Micromonosporaceae bacterium]|nr:AAA domain-containing protein [Micromonosporaceae bacterium]